MRGGERGVSLHPPLPPYFPADSSSNPAKTYLKKRQKLRTLVLLPADAGREVLKPVQGLVHGGAGPPHPLWQRVLCTLYSYTYLQMRGGRCLSLSRVSYMVGQARLTRSGSEYFSSTKPTRNRTYKQRRPSQNIQRSREKIPSRRLNIWSYRPPKFI
jgi:hypothetical protein